MSSRILSVPTSLWNSTWHGLRIRGGGCRESACVWAGRRAGSVETASAVIFLDDLPGTSGHPLQHRTSRAAVGALLARARELELQIVADIHTHPSDWVELSLVDQAHPIEFRVGLLALVLPDFAIGVPELSRAGVHEYLGRGHWATLGAAEASQRVRIDEGHQP